jgi:MYXO-CTERM domain-containing protein
MVDDAGLPEDAATAAPDVRGAPGDLGAPAPRETSGCGCATTGRRGSPWGVVALLVALGVRRRRARGARPVGRGARILAGHGA